MSIISIRDLKFKYGLVKKIANIKNLNNEKGNVLKGINLELKEGLNVLLGPNGTGKTTLMKLLGTFYGFNNGEIYLDDLNYRKDIEKIRSKIAYLPQNFKVYPTISGREFLELMASLRKITNSQEKINEIITELEMEEYIDKRIKTYSGGMNQKLGIAQLLIGDPKVIIIDEPTVGLDPEQRNIIREVLNEISENRIVIVSTHIVEDIEVNCDNLIIMKKGQVIYEGDKKTLLERYKNNIYVKVLSNKELRDFKKENIIVSKIQIDDKYEVKYYSKENRGDTKANINLEEAYIICQNV